MKTRIAILLPLVLAMNSSALSGGATLSGPQPGHADGVLQSIENATVTQAGEDFLVTRKDKRAPVEIVFTRCQGLGVQYQENQ